MKKLIILLSAVGFTILSLSAEAFDGQALSSEAKITMKEAREIALQIYPGKILKEELEKEKGGSGLRYSFDIKQLGKPIQEIGVDAVTGRVLENAPEGPNAD